MDDQPLPQDLLRPNVGTVGHIDHGNPETQALRTNLRASVAEDGRPLDVRSADPRTAAFNKRQLLDNVIEWSRKKWRVAPGEAVVIPLQNVAGDQLVPVKPFQDLIALREFFRDQTTFEFYSLYPGYRPIQIRTRNDLTMMNMSRIKYGQYLVDKGYCRPAFDDEVPRNDVQEVLRQTVEQLKSNKKAKVVAQTKA